MDTVREGIRDGAIDRGSYGRLACTACDRKLGLANEQETIGTIMECPECGTQWREL